jgi:peptidoglycan hydrolase-like protein with peptidoglycan-binding domain
MSAAPAQAAGVEQHPTVAPGVRPVPAASWHGRPIRRPVDDGATVAQAVAAGDARLTAGAGYSRPGGSQAVREVQRLLHRIGYRAGPVDGLYGPLTRSAVQWFQIKHGLRPTGKVGAVELAMLRLRADGKSPVRARGVRVPTAAPAVARVARGAGAAGGGLAVLAVALVAGVFASLVAGGLALTRRARFRIPARHRGPATSGASASAVGYLRTSDDREEKRHAEAIQQACAERGWAVSQIVREGRVNGTDAQRRPGLALAFEELDRRRGGRLVASRLADVGRTRRELATVLDWCSRSRVDLVALDVGLDTGTPAGSLAARCLVAVGDGRRNRPRRAGPERARVRA